MSGVGKRRATDAEKRARTARAILRAGGTVTGAYARALGAPPATSVERALNRQAMKNAGYVDWASAYNAGVPPDLGYSLANTGEFICTIPQNATVSGRVGNKIKYKSLQYRAFVESKYVEPAVAPVPEESGVCRGMLIFVYDRRPTGGPLPPALSLVLKGVTIPTTVLNDEGKDRFIIIKRHEFVLTGQRNNGGGAGTAALEGYVKMKGLPCTYKGSVSTGAIADVMVGAMYLYFVADPFAYNTPTIASCRGMIQSRVRFADVVG